MNLNSIIFTSFWGPFHSNHRPCFGHPQQFTSLTQTKTHQKSTTFQPKIRVQVTSDPKYCSDSLRCSKSLVADSDDSYRKIGWQYVLCSAQKGPASYTPASPGGLFFFGGVSAEIPSTERSHSTRSLDC